MRFLAAVFLFPAPLFAQVDCAFSVLPVLFTVNSAQFPGGSVTVTSGGNCTFVAASRVPWIHITSDSGGFTPGAVTFTVDANPGPTSRSGAMTIALQTVTVNQAGRTDCIYGIGSKSQSFPVGGGPSSLAVQANCPWSAVSNANWITLTGGNQGASSNGIISFRAAPNTCVSPRSGSIRVVTGVAPEPVLSVTEDGSPDNLTLPSSATTAGSGAGDYRVTLTTGDGCAWNAISNVSWMRITSGSSGTGNGGFVYHLLENTSVARTGIIQIGPLAYTVTQQAPAALPVVLSSVANAANYATDAVSPGEIVTLFGAGMGPASIATLQVSNNTVTNSLAGTQVFFDDIATPVIYTRHDQVSAVVPYEVAGKASTKVQVQYQGAASNTMIMPVQAATPAIFSIDSSGTGPGAILNQDNTLNSSANPAARGTIVAIYLTGGGITAPPSSDGSVTGVPPPLLTQAVTVTIGGVVVPAASVTYAGAAPGSVAGLTQINAQVPPGGPTGIAVPVIVKIGNFSSTGVATIAVK